MNPETGNLRSEIGMRGIGVPGPRCHLGGGTTSLSDTPNLGFRGFTLIEVLVASAILAVMLVVFLSVSNYASQAWKGSQEKMEEFSTARVVMNRIRADLESIIIRQDLPLFPNNAMGFMTVKRGVSSDANTRQLSYVEYAANSSNQIVRSSRAYLLTGDVPPFSTNSSIPAPTTTDINPLASGVIGFQSVFLNKDGTWSTNFNSTNSVAVRVSLLVVSSDGLKYLQNAGRLSAVTAAMALTSADITNSTNSPEGIWNDRIGPGMDSKTARSLRAFERLFFLPNSN